VVGRELGVRHVLSGRARREGDRVRLSLSLVEASSGQVVWADQRDLPRADLSTWVGDIAGSLARTLMVEYGDAVAADVRTLAPSQVQADDLALQGMGELLRSVARENWERASKSFEAGLALDPDCIRCLGGLTLAQCGLVLWEWTGDRAASLAKAERTLARLKTLAPERQITHLGAWNLAFIGQDWGGAMALADRLAKHYPNDPVSHHYRCSSLLRLGRFDESIAACERAQRISPRDSRVSVWQGLIGFNHFQLGRHAQAEHAARASVMANPRVPFYSLVLAAALAEQGRRDEAAAVLRDAVARHPDFRASRITGIWASRDARFLAGRDRIVARVVELGFPP
jgi:adenylate cyclase